MVEMASKNQTTVLRVLALGGAKSAYELRKETKISYSSIHLACEYLRHGARIILLSRRSDFNPKAPLKYGITALGLAELLNGDQLTLAEMDDVSGANPGALPPILLKWSYFTAKGVVEQAFHALKYACARARLPSIRELRAERGRARHPLEADLLIPKMAIETAEAEICEAFFEAAMTGSAHLLGVDPRRLRRAVEADPELSLFYALMVYRREREHMLLAHHESTYKGELRGRLNLKDEWLLNPLIGAEAMRRVREMDERLKSEGIDIESQLSAIAGKIFKPTTR
jgi:hypothetical protein